MYKTQAISYDTRSRIFWACVGISVSCLFVYIFAVNMAVRNTVARQALENQVANVSTNLGELEFSYIALKNQISLDMAYARGFQNVSATQYIARGESRSLTMNVTGLGVVNR